MSTVFVFSLYFIVFIHEDTDLLFSIATTVLYFTDRFFN